MVAYVKLINDESEVRSKVFDLDARNIFVAGSYNASVLCDFVILPRSNRFRSVRIRPHALSYIKYFGTLLENKSMKFIRIMHLS
jgi:hypothetical protein